jgi:hypothetical protein
MERAAQHERIWHRFQDEMAGRRMMHVELPEGYSEPHLRIDWRAHVDEFEIVLDPMLWQLIYRPLGDEALRRVRMAELWPKRDLISKAFGEPVEIRAMKGHEVGALFCPPRAEGTDQPPHLWPAMVDHMIVDLAKLRDALEGHVFAWHSA